MQQTIMDKETFTRQVIQNQEALFRTARAILRQDQDAEDAVQEAICSAFTHRALLRDQAKFKPWILRIVANQCYEQCRRRRPTVDLADVEGVLPAENTDPTERLTLWQAVLSLPEDLRLTVTLFYYDDLSIREISKVLSVSEAAVKTRLSRGRARLRTMLRET